MEIISKLEAEKIVQQFVWASRRVKTKNNQLSEFRDIVIRDWGAEI